MGVLAGLVGVALLLSEREDMGQVSPGYRVEKGGGCDEHGASGTSRSR